MKQRGITLLEILVSLLLTAIISVAVVQAFGTGLRIGPNIVASNDTAQKQLNIEERLRSIISHAWINTAAGDQTTYFTTNPQIPVAVSTGSTGAATTATAGTSSQAVSSGGSNSGAPGGGANELVFTAMGFPPKNSALYNDDDFETNNENRGPAGGTIEYGIALTPVGNGNGATGVFLREQAPADTDPTQGGNEQLLIPDVDTLSFEFWDGTTWQTSWDTPNMTPKRLPAAVRVTYSTNGTNQHCFIVVLPNSDVTITNPVSSTGSTGSTGSTTGGSGA